MEANAVFSGGGVKGIAFVGAIKVFEEMGYRFRKLAGTSSGAIVASLLAAGYTGDEINQLIRTLDYKRIIAKNIWDRIPLGRPLRLLFKKGLYSGDYLENWIDQQLVRKNVSTFSDLPPDRLQIIASNLSKGTILQFPKDAHLFTHRPEKMKISRAIRMSISIPFFFDPIRIKNKEVEYIVDGGVISNFPIWLFDHETPDKIPTFGFNIRSKNTEHYYKISDPFTMLYALISVMLENQDQKYIEKQDAVRTIFIKTDGVKATDFYLGDKEQEVLYLAGKEAAYKFFRTWNFSDYVSRYVRKKQLSVNLNTPASSNKR